ncbi:MAG: DUF4340 domain-containing protein [Clostridia bacterium]|nr:DUF4340 domain-containing protein [Clostridia bacterium]
MNNIPENEKINELGAEITESSSEEELSTVFSDPTEHKKKAENSKKKKRLPIVIASVLAVAVLVGGTLAVVKLIPEREDDTSSTPAIEEINVLDLKSDDFKTVTVTNKEGTFKLYSVIEENESSTSSETTETVTWYLDGYDKELISTISTENVASAAAYITATREVTQRTAADCGLDNPAVTVKVVTSDDGEFSIYFGDESPDKSGHYLKLSTDDKIYVVESTTKSEFEFNALQLANTDALPAFTLTDEMADYKNDSDALASFDTITVSGKNFEKPVVIAPNNSDDEISQYIGYNILSPSKRIANDEAVSAAITLFQSGVSVTGAYSFDVSAASLAKFGLDNPDVVITMKILDTTLTYKFALQEDGNYAAVCDGAKLIKIVSASASEILGYELKDFYSSWVALVSIDTISEFSFASGQNTYSFGIEKVEDEEFDEDYIITYKGEKIVTDDFQSFYQECISIACTDFTVEQTSGTPEYTMVFKYNEDIGGEYRVEFIKVSETRYEYKINGTFMGRVTSSSLKKLLKSAQKLVGETA